MVKNCSRKFLGGIFPQDLLGKVYNLIQDINYYMVIVWDTSAYRVRCDLHLSIFGLWNR